MLINKLLPREIKLAVNSYIIAVLIQIGDDNVLIYEIYITEGVPIICKKSIIFNVVGIYYKGMSPHNVRTINPKFRDKLLSEDPVIKEMALNIIINENKNFIKKHHKIKI